MGCPYNRTIARHAHVVVTIVAAEALLADIELLFAGGGGARVAAAREGITSAAAAAEAAAAAAATAAAAAASPVLLCVRPRQTRVTAMARGRRWLGGSVAGE